MTRNLTHRPCVKEKLKSSNQRLSRIHSNLYLILHSHQGKCYRKIYICMNFKAEKDVTPHMHIKYKVIELSASNNQFFCNLCR